jgi:tol-pal system beta propeller repeat protein TolB
LKLAAALVLAWLTPLAAAPQGLLDEGPLPCLSDADCGAGMRCVQSACIQPWRAWQAPLPSVGLVVKDIDAACPDGMGTAIGVRDRLAEALRNVRLRVKDLTLTLDPTLRPTHLDVLDEALAEGLGLIVEISLKCARDGGLTAASLSVLDVSRLTMVERLAEQVVFVGRTMPSRHAGLDTWVNRLMSAAGGPQGWLGSRVLMTCKLPKRVKEIFSLDARGDDLRRETHHENLTLLPAWGPGGEVAATSYALGNPDIHMGKRAFFTTPGLNTGIDFDSEGKRFVVASGEDGAQDILLGDARTGKVLRQLTTDTGIDTAPAFNPAGDAVVFVSDRSGSPQIYVLELTSTKLTRVSGAGLYNTSPAWSPDGRTLAWNRRRGARTYDVITADVKDPRGTERRRTHGEASFEGPTFSPDGRMLAFAQIEDGGSSPMVLDLLTGTMRSLAIGHLPGSCSQPAWGRRPTAKKNTR